MDLKEVYSIMDSKQVRETLQIIDLFWSIGLFIFFMYQKYMKKRCKFEVLYVTGVGSITDLVKIAFTDYTPGSITIKENEIERWHKELLIQRTCIETFLGDEYFTVFRKRK